MSEPRAIQPFPISTAGIALVAGFASFAITAKFTKIFTDVLGSSDHLPGLAKLIIGSQGAFPGMILIVAAAVTLVLMFLRMRNAANWAAGITLLLTIFLTALFVLAMFLPLVITVKTI